MWLQALIKPFVPIIVQSAPAVVMGEHPLDSFKGAAQPNGIAHHGLLGLLFNGIEYIHEAIEG